VPGTQPISGEEIPAGHGVVEVHVRELDQLFHSMDPAPFHEKGLHPDAEEFIVAAAKELPSRAPAALVVYLDKPGGLPDEGHVLGAAIRRHFAREAQLLRWELRRLIRRGLISLIIGLTVLAAALAGGEYLKRRLGGGHVADVLGTSLHIGGWVAMSMPLQIFLYDWWPILGRRMLYDRLARMPVKIVYTADAPGDAEVLGTGVVARPATTFTSPNGNGFAQKGV
jgi:hypothetical protein